MGWPRGQEPPSCHLAGPRSQRCWGSGAEHQPQPRSPRFSWGEKAAEAAMSRLTATKKSGLVVGTQNLGFYPQPVQGEATGRGISKLKSRAVEI